MVAGNLRDKTFWVGSWFIDPQKCQVQRGAVVRALRPRSMELLVCLADHAGSPLLKAVAMERVWPDVLVEESAIAQCVSEIRTALGDTPQAQEVVRTIPKRGYELVAPVRVAQPTDTEPPGPPRRASSGLKTFLSAVLAGIAVGAALGRGFGEKD